MPESYTLNFNVGIFLFGPQTQKSTFFGVLLFEPPKKNTHLWPLEDFTTVRGAKFTPLALRIGRRFLMLPREQ